MFIIKLGQEALTKLEEQLTEPISKSNNFYNSPHNVESSILYNLLAADENVKLKSYLYNKDTMDVDPEVAPRPSTVMNLTNHNCSESMRDYVNLSPRPFSAPDTLTIPKTTPNQTIPIPPTNQHHLKHNHSCCYSANSPSVSCSTDSFIEEPMDLSAPRLVNEASSESVKFIVNSWLIAMIELVNTNKQLVALADLPINIRLHLLQTSWHRLLITLLYDHFAKFSNHNSIAWSNNDNLWSFIHSLTGVSNSNVKIYKMCKNLINELYEIFNEISKLNLDIDSMNCFRIGIFLAGDNDEFNKKLLSVMDKFIYDKLGPTTLDRRLVVGDLMDKIVKLNSVIMETVFYSHLNDSVDNILDKLIYATS